MTLLYLSNYFNHHQKPLADALYGLLGDNYHFIETSGVPEFRKKLGYQEMTAPYVIRYSEETEVSISRMIMDYDAVIYGEAPLKMIKRRLLSGKLTFRDDECRYRSISRFLKWPIYTYSSYFLNKGYLLCASAFGPIDYLLSGMKPKKCYRWGYFPKVNIYEDFDRLLMNKEGENVNILWCGRLIPLKHPESLLYVAEHLKNDGYNFELNVIGDGKLEGEMKRKAKEKNLDDCLHFLGSMKPEKVRSYMEKANIFLFTSDRNEGWGAVLNESMNSGCAVVAGSNIGSVSYLLEDGVNGFVYKDLNWNNLYSKVKLLFDNPPLRRSMGEKAYYTMKETWNGEHAAKNLMLLCDALIHGNSSPIKEGPCSPAPLLMRRWHGIIRML